MKKICFLSALLSLLLLLGCSSIPIESTQQPASVSPSPSTSSRPSKGGLSIHFIDVGQADSILILSPEGAAVLVDAGNNEDGPEIVNYLKAQGVKELAAVVATHPHEDHIGGMDQIIDSFPVKQVYLPTATTTTKTFEDMIASIKVSGAKRIQAKAGVVLDVPGLSARFLAPSSPEYDELNNYSAVLKLTYGTTSFLLTGDAEEISEKEMLKHGDLQADLLKVGHHGSYSSTSKDFLKAVSPQTAVISVGADNAYGHPNDEVLNRLSAAGTSIFRTDKLGTIVAMSNGSTITIGFRSSPIESSVAPPPAPLSVSVQISTIDLYEEIVTITNVTNSVVNLTGWKLVSKEGSQTFNFPAGTTLPAGGALHIVSGTKAEPGSNALLWSKENIWNNNGDTGALYDAQGSLVSRK